MNHMKTNDELLNEIIKEKKLKERTIINYKQSIKQFEKITHQNLLELIREQEQQRKQGVLWKDTILKKTLIEFRNTLHEKYKDSTATIYYGQIIAILNFYEVEIGKIKPIKKKKERLNFISDLPTREEIRDCINSIDNPIIKAVTLFLSSTGLSPVDALDLKIKDYIEITSEYHNYNLHHDIKTAIKEMKDKEAVITLIGYRHKSSQQYITFASPESVKAINIYLLTREDELKLESKLFKMSQDNLKVNFRRINHKLGLGVTRKGRSRFCMSNMRAYHNNQLKKAGWDIGEINIVSGRVNRDVIYEHYLNIDENELKEKYIKALPFIVIEDINKVKTELDTVREEKEILERENTEFKQYYDGLREEIEFIKSKQAEWDKIKNDG